MYLIELLNGTLNKLSCLGSSPAYIVLNNGSSFFGQGIRDMSHLYLLISIN